MLGRWNCEVANMNLFLKGYVKIVYGGLPAASNESAIENFKKAIQLAPNRIIHHLQLAHVYHLAGKQQLVAEELKACRELTPLGRRRHGRASHRPQNFGHRPNGRRCFERKAHFMKMLSIQRTRGFTRRELMVVICVLVVLIIILIPACQKARQKSWRIRCISNMKEIGAASRIWAGDHGDRVPAFASITNGGWNEFLKSSNAGPSCWSYYKIMADEMGQAAWGVVCPADERRPAKNFGADFKDNSKVSYFVGVNANDAYPQSIQGGDRNLGPGTVPAPDYGYSPANGQGKDVVIEGPVCWSLKMHSHGNPAGAGNIVLGDGSAQQVSSAALNQNWMKNAQTGTNGANLAGIRLVFP